MPTYLRLGAALPATPLVISVPHAGRVYPASLLDDALIPVEKLAALEDRLVDRLAGGAVAVGATVLIATRARAWIDLNRHEREIDPAMLSQPVQPDRLMTSAKLRGGLGLIPRRLAGSGEIWRRRLSLREIEARIEADHRPWHAAIADRLAACHARFGTAMLIDLHSLPPLAPPRGDTAARIILGDRNGRSCAPRVVEALEAVAAAAGLKAARNQPYAGGYTLDRHGRAGGGIHAVQVEIDRTLYLAPDQRAPGTGMAATERLVTDMAKRMLTLCGGTIAPVAIAAE